MVGRTERYLVDDVETVVREFIEACRRAESEGIGEVSSGFLWWDNIAKEYWYAIYDVEAGELTFESNGSTASDAVIIVEDSYQIQDELESLIEEIKEEENRECILL